MIDIRDAMNQRAEMIANNPNRIARIEVYTDGSREWGIITVMNANRDVNRYEFIEDENSWRRANAMEDYNIGVEQGYPVYVVVPDSSYREFVDSMGTSGKMNFDVSTYGRCEIPAKVRA
jgi:hypothetical protein